MKKIVICLIQWYRRNLSPLKKYPTCRFLPTCSEYAVLAIEKYGLLKGGVKTVYRILRCNPFCKGGVDYP
ncbi:membrane protein insertion efficiency factor YidD [Acetivibrio sp. MSJd-27]|uniref:membrane protein insertion efficiency factor YidD n=1 Tax=Acetivibrio sp. MSJd-27 TaxID=2841523 RepID=UPI0015AF188B|nr:membrane protein insertion efficiency factor YidD [Acetivibrio sp. MSJd-27]MBU5449548.1 membrane protein insertion efficiency factor YidD [Acetivibrio sp. MSJd-27]